MAKLGHYRRPREFKDEDKWFRYFTKVQLLYLAIFGGPGIFLFMFFKGIGLRFFGCLFFELFAAAGIFLPRIDVPQSWYLWGGGIPVRTILVRLIKKNLPWNKVLYIRKNVRLS